MSQDPGTLNPSHEQVLAADFDHPPAPISVFGGSYDYCETCGFAVTPDGKLHAQTSPGKN